MSALTILQKACKGKVYKRLSDLPVGEYLIENFQLTTVKNGACLVKINLEEYFIFLPERIGKNFNQTFIDEMNAMKTIFVFDGMDPISKRFVTKKNIIQK